MSIMDFFKTPPNLNELTPEEVKSKITEGNTKIVDVRTKREYESGHIKEATSIPLSRIKKMAKELSSDEEYILICATGHRSRAAGATLLRRGFKHVSHLKGGMGAWKKMEKHEK